MYTFNPAFRAEVSKGRRHLAEFWMLEVEEAFLQGEYGLSVLQDNIESLVKESLSSIMEECKCDLQLVWKDYPDREV